MSIIKWVTSDAKKIIIEDLEGQLLPLYEIQLSTNDAWAVYSQLPEFAKVPFSQFKSRLKDHRAQVLKRRERVGEEEAAFIQFRAKNPRKTHNNRFEPVFDMLPAKLLLRQDVKDGLHLTMTPNQLQKFRPEYHLPEHHALSPDKFKGRIYQEARRQKYFYWLKLKTAEWNKRKKNRHATQLEHAGSMVDFV
jgi:hypothetical protein